MGVATEPEEFRNVGAGLTATANAAGGENKAPASPKLMKKKKEKRGIEKGQQHWTRDRNRCVCGCGALGDFSATARASGPLGERERRKRHGGRLASVKRAGGLEQPDGRTQPVTFRACRGTPPTLQLLGETTGRFSLNVCVCLRRLEFCSGTARLRGTATGYLKHW